MDGMHIRATAHVKLTKLDEKSGEVMSVEEHDVNLTEEEAKSLWRLQQQA